jgi:succinate dehydrogenase / fumarate reductase cytochrome b subunit
MDDRRYFLLKRLHSLLGVIPLAGFVVFHLFENSHSVAGAEAFNATTRFIRSQPYLYIIEVGLLAPIAFHALMGLWLAKAAKHNVGSFTNAQNIAYTLQRITGLVLFFFIGYHVWTTRFAGIPSDRMFQTLAEQFSRPAVAAFYVLGILSAAFHLANGLWGFAVAWGLVSGQESMNWLWKACMGVFVVVALMGLNALAGFRGHGVDLFQHEKSAVAATAPQPASVPATPPSK